MKELRLESIADITAANAFLPSFVERHNARFAKTPRRSDDLHRALNIGPDRLRQVLCLREERHVGQQLSFRYERQHVILERNDLTEGLAGKYVDVLTHPDGRIEVCWNGVTLNHRVFAKDQQRVTQAAIVENKHLSAVLEHIKAHQEAEAAKPRRPPVQRTKYIPTGRRNDGWNSPAARKARAAVPGVAGQTSGP